MRKAHPILGVRLFYILPEARNQRGALVLVMNVGFGVANPRPLAQSLSILPMRGSNRVRKTVEAVEAGKRGSGYLWFPLVLGVLGNNGQW